MLGYPGAGKTTAANTITELTGAVHLASDKIRLEMFPHPQFTPEEHAALYESIDEKTETLLEQGKDVIYDANLNQYTHRQEKYDICERVGAKPVLLWLQTPRDVSKERAVHDSRNHLWPRDEAPDKMFERLVGVFEPPHPDEPYIMLDGTKIHPEYIKQALNL